MNICRLATLGHPWIGDSIQMDIHDEHEVYKHGSSLKDLFYSLVHC